LPGVNAVETSSNSILAPKRVETLLTESMVSSYSYSGLLALASTAKLDREAFLALRGISGETGRSW
jgi:hypothetical protein